MRLLEEQVAQVEEVGERANEGQANGAYGTGFTAGSLAGVGVKVRSKTEVGFDKKLTEVRRGQNVI